MLYPVFPGVFAFLLLTCLLFTFARLLYLNVLLWISICTTASKLTVLALAFDCDAVLLHGASWRCLCLTQLFACMHHALCGVLLTNTIRRLVCVASHVCRLLS